MNIWVILQPNIFTFGKIWSLPVQSVMLKGFCPVFSDLIGFTFMLFDTYETATFAMDHARKLKQSKRVAIFHLYKKLNTNSYI